MAYQDSLAALSDPTRRLVFEALRGGPRAVAEIAAELPVSRPAVSQHLKVLAAAGLDVFAGEPNLDPRYAALQNTFLLPHVGSATHETRDAMGFCCLDNLDAFFAGRPCPNALT